MSPKPTKSIETKIKDLENLVAWFDSDEFVIEKSIDNYNQAKALAKEIYQDVDQIKNEIKLINQP